MLVIDRDHIPESDPEDDIPKISLQEMLEDLKLEDTDPPSDETACAAMATE